MFTAQLFASALTNNQVDPAQTINRQPQVIAPTIAPAHVQAESGNGLTHQELDTLLTLARDNEQSLLTTLQTGVQQFEAEHLVKTINIVARNMLDMVLSHAKAETGSLNSKFFTTFSKAKLAKFFNPT